MAYKNGRDPEFEYYQSIYNKANTNSAQKQMDFQKMMSDTSHQREVVDLMKAGLNPALSLNNGASSPSGAYANVDSSSNSARSQQKIAQQQVEAQLKMNQQSLENAYRIAAMQAAMQYKVAELQSMWQYQMGVDVANINQETSAYSQDQENARQQKGFDTPTTPGALLTQMFREVFNPSTYNNARQLTKQQLQKGNTTAEVYYNRQQLGTNSKPYSSVMPKSSGRGVSSSSKFSSRFHDNTSKPHYYPILGEVQKIGKEIKAMNDPYYGKRIYGSPNYTKKHNLKYSKNKNK